MDAPFENDLICSETGFNFDECIVGTTGNDVIYGEDGDDLIFGKAGKIHQLSVTKDNLHCKLLVF